MSNGQKQKQMDHEIREMVSALTDRLSNLQKSGHHDEDDDGGVRVITLAGSNTGATMRGGEMEPTPDPEHDYEAFLTYVNNNIQAINNSIMLGGEYHANDPGVHLDISDYHTEDEAQARKKGKTRKGRGNSKTHNHHQHEHSDYVDAIDDADVNHNRTNH